MTTELTPKAAEIVAHTRALLEAGGYNSFSYADISARVHISKPSIHHHFPSKAELVRTVVAQYREEARAGMEALDRTFADPVAELHAYADYWAKCIRGGTSSFCICAMLATELPSIPDEVAHEVRGHFQDLSTWLAALIEAGRADGRLRPQDSSEIEAKAFMSTVHGAMLAARAFGDPDVFLAIVRPALGRLIPAS